VEYEIQRENEYGKSGNVRKPQDGQFKPQEGGFKSSRNDDTQDQIMRQTCLKAAAEFYAQSSTTENDVVITAARWFTWVKSGDMIIKQ
jgi:hypothetical protein